MVPHLLPMRSLLSDLRDRLRNERSRWSEISDRHQPKSVIAMDRNGRSGCSEIRRKKAFTPRGSTATRRYPQANPVL